MILVCRVPLGPLDQRDQPALLDLKAAKAHLDPLAPLDPLDLRDQPLALVGLFMYAGDEPPVLAHLEQSWCTQEGLEGAIMTTVVEEQTNYVCQIPHNTSTMHLELKGVPPCVVLSMKHTQVNRSGMLGIMMSRVQCATRHVRLC